MYPRQRSDGTSLPISSGEVRCSLAEGLQFPLTATSLILIDLGSCQVIRTCPSFQKLTRWRRSPLCRLALEVRIFFHYLPLDGRSRAMRYDYQH